MVASAERRIPRAGTTTGGWFSSFHAGDAARAPAVREPKAVAAFPRREAAMNRWGSLRTGQTLKLGDEPGISLARGKQRRAVTERLDLRTSASAVALVQRTMEGRRAAAPDMQTPAGRRVHQE